MLIVVVIRTLTMACYGGLTHASMTVRLIDLVDGVAVLLGLVALTGHVVLFSRLRANSS